MAYPETPLWLELARLGRDFAVSGAVSLRPNRALSSIRSHCLFIAAPRTGHSLVGAMLDAHPQTAIAHELGVPKYLAAHFSPRQVQLLLIANARHHAARGRRHIHYSHAVPGQWQGRFELLEVVGDKHGEGFLLSVQARPWLVQSVLDRLSPVRFVQVVRNPYDSIASVTTSSKRGQAPEQAAAYFESLYATLASVREQLEPGQLQEVRFEDLLDDPRKQLRTLCRFLGLEAPADYLDACAAIVLDAPEDHRGLVEWDAATRDRVDALIARHTFLLDYRFDD